MATRSVYQIDVESEAFKAFKSAFDDHRASVASMPRDWKKTGDAMKAAAAAGKKELKSEAELIAAMAVGLNQVVRAQSELNRVSGNTGNTFKGILQTTKGILTNVTTTTMEFLKWGALGVLSAGAAGFYAFGRSAGAASNLRSASGALGVLPGQLNAARDVYGPLLGGKGAVDSLLANIAAAQADPAKWRALTAGLGLGGRGLTASPGELLPDVLSGLANAYGRSGGKAPLWNAMGLGDIADLGAGRLLSARQGELGRSGALYRSAAQTLDPGAGNLETLQNANVKLDIAKTRVENVFLQAFARLDKSGSIDHLTDSIVSTLEAFAKNPNVGKDIDQIAKSLEGAASYLASKQFQDDVISFVTLMHKIAHPIETAKNYLPTTNAGHLYSKFDRWATGQLAGSHPSPASDAAGVVGGITGAVHRTALRAMTEIAEQKYGLPKGLMWNIAGIESSYGRNLTGPVTQGGWRARGIFQDSPGILKQYGIQLGNDASEVTGNARYLADLLRMNGGNLNGALRQFGGFVNADPTDYINRATANLNLAPNTGASRLGVTVTTHQTPGSDTNTTAAAMAH